jgi:hypothetical protein
MRLAVPSDAGQTLAIKRTQWASLPQVSEVIDTEVR